MSQIEHTEELDRYLTVLQSIDSDLKGRLIDQFYATEEDREAYTEHLDVFTAGKRFRERFASGGNRTGKSTLGAYEVACHATGIYPCWWPGHTFTHATRIWCAGDTREAVREVGQRKLLGLPGQHGTGMVPRDSIIKTTPRQGTPDGVDTIQIKHISGGVSTVSFRTYSEGRGPWQGVELDFLWYDEEPPADVHSEGMMRLMQTVAGRQPGRSLLTATPMKPFSEVIARFLEGEHRIDDADRFAAFLTWDNTPHLTEDEKQEYLKTIPAHEVDARTRGIPMMGAAGIYPFKDSDIVVEPFQVPGFWRRGYGFDPGWKYTAGIWVAQNPDNGQHVIYDEYKASELDPVKHTAAVRARSQWLTGAIDPASQQRNQKDGTRFIDVYQDAGLKLLLADNAVGAGIEKCRMMFATDQLKIMSHCTRTLGELHLYQYMDNGKPRKSNDHLMDALRYILMTSKAFRLARPYVKPRVRTLSKMRKRQW